MKSYSRFGNALLLLLLTIFAILIQGYHPGAEDDGVYLAAIKQDLNPKLFPHDSDFFKLQLQATVFDKVIAGSVKATHLPVAWVALIWHFASILLVLWGCFRIARLCFDEPYAQWAGVTLVAALLTLPVTGTGLYLVDQHLHPRALATAAILAAMVAVLERRWLLTGLLLAATFAVHPIMASFGISYCLFLAWSRRGPITIPVQGVAMLMPLGWIFEPVTPAWQQAAASRNFYFLSRWEWYEWVGVFAPMLLLWWFNRIGKRRGSPYLEKISSSLVYFGIFQLAVACAMILPDSLMRLRPLQPMRYLQILYVLLALLGGGLLGQQILRRRIYRWAILFVPLCAGMFYAQRQLYAGTEHLELPGRNSGNGWLQAFAWIRTNTPQDAYFAVDPHYLELPYEDFHGFRALAERSVLADAVKDPSVVTQVPMLAHEWQKEMAAQAGWKNFHADDFQRLHQDFGVDWVVVSVPAAVGLECPYSNPVVSVCHIPATAPPR